MSGCSSPGVPEKWSVDTDAVHLLWFRPDRRARWSPVARAATFAEAVALIGIGDRHHGDWMPLPVGRHPNNCGCPDWRLGERAGPGSLGGEVQRCPEDADVEDAETLMAPTPAAK